MEYIEIENRLIKLAEISYLDYDTEYLVILIKNKSEVRIKCERKTPSEYYQSLKGILKVRAIEDFMGV